MSTNGGLKSSYLEKAIERITPPDKRKRKSEEEIHLTTGKAVSRGRPILIGCCVAILAVGIGLVVGVFVGRSVNTDPYVKWFPGFTDLSAVGFLAVGDWGRNGTHNQTDVAAGMAQVAYDINADYIISTGDNFYTRGLRNESDPLFTTSFSNVYTANSLHVQWFNVLGEHDYYVNPENEMSKNLTFKEARWHLERMYRRKANSCPKGYQGQCPFTIEFFFIDTTPVLDQYWANNTNPMEQCNFTGLGTQQEAVTHIVRVLKEALESSDALFKVVVGHHPIFSSGQYGATFEMQRKILGVFLEHTVDVYISGHDHNLELIQVKEVPTYFITSGAGSYFPSVRAATEPWAFITYYHPTSLFYYGQPGFISASALGPELMIRFHNATGYNLYNMTITKQMW